MLQGKKEKENDDDNLGFTRQCVIVKAMRHGLLTDWPHSDCAIPLKTIS